jgi:hypothetical protein
MNAVLLRPVDAVEPERLLRADAGGTASMNFVPYSDYLQYRDRNQSLSSLVAFYPGWMAREPHRRHGRAAAVMPSAASLPISHAGAA